MREGEGEEERRERYYLQVRGGTFGGSERRKGGGLREREGERRGEEREREIFCR